MGELIEHGLPCEHCGSSDAVAEYSNNYFCFSCERSTPKRKSKIQCPMPDKSLLNEPRYKAKPISTNIVAQKILERAHMTDDLIEAYNLHWTEDLQIWSRKRQAYVSMGPRLIIPHPGGFEAKTLRNSSIKYITYGDKDGLFYANDWPKEGVETACIVEDIFSAIRIGEFMPCVSLIGTNLTKKKEQQLRRLSKNFFIWLDPDKAGRKATHKINSRLSWFADSVIRKSSLKDPKCYTNDEIEEILND